MTETVERDAVILVNDFVERVIAAELKKKLNHQIAALGLEGEAAKRRHYKHSHFENTDTLAKRQGRPKEHRCIIQKQQIGVRHERNETGKPIRREDDKGDAQ